MNVDSHWSRQVGFYPAMGLLIVAIVFLSVRGWYRPVYLDSHGQLIGPVHLDADLRLDLNSATLGQLQSLPQIGPALAARIVEDRHTHGAFATIDDVQRVSGMGPRTVERIRAFVVCGK